MKEKLIQFDGKKVVKTRKNKFGCHGNETKPLFFVVVESITVIIGRSASLLLHVLNVILQKHAKTGTISKMRKNFQNALLTG